jgi:hypothetical protein
MVIQGREYQDAIRICKRGCWGACSWLSTLCIRMQNSGYLLNHLRRSSLSPIRTTATTSHKYISNAYRPPNHQGPKKNRYSHERRGEDS